MFQILKYLLLIYFTIIIIINIQIQFDPHLEIKNISHSYFDIRDTLKTGDLLFLTSNESQCKAVRYYGNFEFSHVGMIIRVDDIIFILESDYDSSYDFIAEKQIKLGVHVISFEEKMLNMYYKNNYFGIKRINKNVNIQKLEQIMLKGKDINFEARHLNFLACKVKLKWYSKFFNRKNHMMCSGFMAYTLRNLEIISDKYPDNFYTIFDIANKLPLINGYQFSEMQPFIFTSNEHKILINKHYKSK